MDDPVIAAIMHDIANIQIKCLQARTNFYYNKAEIACALQLTSVLKSMINLY